LANTLHAERPDRVRIFDDDRIDMRHVERRWQNVFGKPGRGGAAALDFVVFHKALPERLHHPAFDLSFDALRIDGATDIVRRPDAKHLDLAGDGIDFNFGNLAAEYVSLPGPTGTIDRMKTGRVCAKGGRA